MGWWRTESNNVIGDPALNELEQHPEAARWKTPDEIPSDVINAIIQSYQDDLGREPIRAELEALLAFHQGDAGLGVVASCKRAPRPTDP